MSKDNVNKLKSDKALKELFQADELLTDDNEPEQKMVLAKLPIDMVESDEQVRKIFDHIESLAQSICTSGLLSPIRVRPINGTGKFIILEGERRWRACKLAGFTTIDAIIVFSPVNETNRKINQLIENLQRDDMLPLEIARAISDLLAQGLSGKEIAEQLGYAPSFVSLYKDLIDLPEQLCDLGSATIRDAKTLQILKKVHTHCPDIAVELIENALDKDRKISRIQARALLAQCTKSSNGTKEKADELINEPENIPPDELTDNLSMEDKSSLSGTEVDTKSAISSGCLISGCNRNAQYLSLPKCKESSEDCPRAIPSTALKDVPLPYGAESFDVYDVSIEVEIVNEHSNSNYGILSPWIVSKNPSELCVYAQGEYRLVPVGCVRILKVSSKKPMMDSDAGW